MTSKVVNLKIAHAFAIPQKMFEDDKQFQAEYSEFDKVCEKFSEMTADLNGSIEFMSNQIQRILLAKASYYLNSLGTLNRKIEKAESEFASSTDEFEKKLQEGETEVAAKHSIIKRLEEKMAQTEQESNQIDAASAEEDSNMKAENVKLADIESIKDKIKAGKALEAQRSSEHEEVTAALESLQQQLAQDENQIQSIDQQIDLKKEQKDSIEDAIKRTEARLKELTWVCTEIQKRTAPFDELLGNETFQRHLFSTNFFEELKSDMDMLEDDNADLNNELTGFEAQEEEQAPVIQKVRLGLSEKRDELARLKLENQAIDQDQAALTKELKVLDESAEKANAASLNEFLTLQSALAKAQEERQQAMVTKELSVKNNDKMLKDEKIKTLKAQASAKAAMAARRRSSVSSIMSDKDATPVKQESPKVAIKLEPGSSSSQPPKSLKLITPKEASPMTQPTLQPRRSLTPLKVEPSPSFYRLTKENLKRRSDVLKENDIPVELDETIGSISSPKRSRFEEEKAFDSDDSTSVSIFYLWTRLASKLP